MTISLIVAKDRNSLIGKGNSLPWSLPADLKHFKEKTVGKTVVMGRKTFETLKGPLPNRKNVIITRNKGYVAEGCTVIHSVEEFLQLDGDIVVMGGSEVYKLLLPYVEVCHITEIDNEFEGDTYLHLDLSDFLPVSFKQGERNEKNNEIYVFWEYHRISI